MRTDSERADHRSGGAATASGVTRPTGQRWLAWFAVAALAVHLVVLYWPWPVGDGSVTGADKVVHVVAFAVPTLLLGWVTRRAGLVVALFAVHAVLSEVIQGTMLPDRSGDLWDTAADLVGVAVAALVLFLLTRSRRS